MKYVGTTLVIAIGIAIAGCSQSPNVTAAAQQRQTKGMNLDFKVGPPISRPKRDTSGLAKALASKDNNLIISALQKELSGNPEQPEFQTMLALTLEKVGRKNEAKTVLGQVLWPSSSNTSSLMTDARLVERYLTLCEASGDQNGIQRAQQRASEILSQHAQNLPAKQLTRTNEYRAAIAYQAFREARNREDSKEAMTLIRRAVAQDGSVALYQYRLANELLEEGRELAVSSEDVTPAIAKWREGLTAVQRGQKAALRTSEDKTQLDSLQYDLTNYIEMAKRGFFKGAAAARAKSGPKTYRLVSPIR